MRANSWLFFSFKNGDRRSSLTIYNLEHRAAHIHQLITAYQARFGLPPHPPSHHQPKGLTGLNQACRRVFSHSLSQLSLSLGKSRRRLSAGDGEEVAAPSGESRNYKPAAGSSSSNFQRKGLRKSFTFTALGLYGDKRKPLK